MPDFFPKRPTAHLMIYAYEDTNPQYDGLLKVGYTAINVDKRVAQQYPTKRPDGSVPYRIIYRESAMYPDGSSFTDHDVHRMLKRKRIPGMGGEWFRCTVDDVRAAVLAVRNRTTNVEDRTRDFPMRPEQREAVDKTAAYFRSVYEEDSTRYPKFLWNCKMRFGKTFAAYQLAKQMNFQRVLILTFKPGEYQAGLHGDSWKLDLIQAINEALEYAVDRESFIENMEVEGYEVSWSPNRKHITFTCPNGRKCRDSSLHDETFLKENLEALFAYRQAMGFRPSTPEPDEGWLGELAAGWFCVMSDLERDADWQLPAPPVWTDSKQRRREALKKLAMGQKFSGDQSYTMSI